MLASVSDTSSQTVHPPTQNSSEWTLLHRGVFVANMKWLPQIQTLTLCRSLRLIDPSAWKTATHQLLVRYPILSGRLVLTEEASPAFWVHHPLEKHNNGKDAALYNMEDYFQVLDWTENQDAMAHLAAEPTLDQNFAWVRDIIAPSVPAPTSTLEQLLQKSPLLQVRLILLPSQFYVLNVGISHAVADSFTYYRLVDELVHMTASSQHANEPLSWTANSNLVIHEQLTDPADNALVTTSYSWWWADKLNSWWRRWIQPRSCEYIILDQDAIEQQKQQLLDQTVSKDQAPVSFLSSNDVVTAALLQANRRPSYLPFATVGRTDRNDVCIVFCNARSRRRDYQNTHAGNLVDQLILPSRLACNPNDHRRVLQKGCFYEPGQLPYEFLLTASFTFITSWATAQGSCRVAPPQDNVVCHVPHPTPMHSLSMDVAMVFRINDQHLGVAHNFYPRGGTTNDLLHSISVKR